VAGIYSAGRAGVGWNRSARDAWHDWLRTDGEDDLGSGRRRAVIVNVIAGSGQLVHMRMERLGSQSSRMVTSHLTASYYTFYLYSTR
jgi:hypothetical protein